MLQLLHNQQDSPPMNMLEPLAGVQAQTDPVDPAVGPDLDCALDTHEERVHRTKTVNLTLQV